MLRSEAIGRLTADPVLKTISIRNEDVQVCEFSIAVNYGAKDNQQTEYIDCQAWRGLAGVIGSYAKKGRKVYVSGKQRTRKFTITKDNVDFNDRRVEWTLDEFEFCDDKGSSPDEQTTEAKPYETPVNADKVPF